MYDEKGILVETLRDDGGTDKDGKKEEVIVPWVSEVEPLGEYLYFASWYNPFLARMKRNVLQRKVIHVSGHSTPP